MKTASWLRGASAARLAALLAAANGLFWLPQLTAAQLPEPPGAAFACDPYPALPRGIFPAPDSSLDPSLGTAPAATDRCPVNAGVLAPEPPETFDLRPRAPVRPYIAENLGLFSGVEFLNFEEKTRAITPGIWLGNRVRLRGGIGYTEQHSTRERDIAIGFGVDFAF